MKKLKLVALFLFFILLFSGLTAGSLSQRIVSQKGDDFYFVHITDTHVMHKLFDRNEVTRKIFASVIENVTSFEEKPAFVVITGDLVEWGGSGISGALNYQTFLSCLYEKDDQLYADPSYSIPVYTTPGNHDYIFHRNLINYHRFVDRTHILQNDRYIVTYENLSLFFLDSGPNFYLRPSDWLDILGGGLTRWDIKWLDSALSSCSSQHKIVLMHHPAVNYRNKHGEMVDVIARNREVFLGLCEDYDVDLVLAGHTHDAVVFDGDENVYEEFPLNCSQYPAFFVQSDDCKEGCHYRNITIVRDDIWLEASVELNVTSADIQDDNIFIYSHLEILLGRSQLTKPSKYIFLDIQKDILKGL